jgi:hypothetical protein
MSDGNFVYTHEKADITPDTPVLVGNDTRDAYRVVPTHGGTVTGHELIEGSTDVQAAHRTTPDTRAQSGHTWAGLGLARKYPP